MKLGILLSLTVMATASAQAAVLTNVITTAAGDPFGGLGDWEISTTAGDATLIGDFTETGLVATTGTVGIGHDWFLVDEGTAFTPSYAAMATPFSTNGGGASDNALTLTGEPFFLGVQLGNREFEPEQYRIGWVELESDGSTLTALRSATEDSGSGLYVGSLNVVPEPSTASFAMLGLLGLIARRRRVA